MMVNEKLTNSTISELSPKKNFVLSIGILLVVFISMVTVLNSLQKKYMEYKTAVDLVGPVVFHINDINVDGSNTIISGNLYDKGYETTDKWEILLLDLQSKRLIKSQSQKTDMTRINDNMKFSLAFRKNIGMGRYEFYLKKSTINEDDVLYRTGRYLDRGKLAYVLDVTEPMLDSDELKELFKDGIMLAEKSDIGMYIIRDKDTLYWVWDKQFADEYGKKRMNIVHFSPIDVACLPEDRKQYGFQNLDFLFDDREIKEIVSSNYRVASVPIDEEWYLFSYGQYAINGEDYAWVYSLYLNE